MITLMITEETEHFSSTFSIKLFCVQKMKSNADDEEFWTWSRLGAFDFGPEDEVSRAKQV